MKHILSLLLCICLVGCVTTPRQTLEDSLPFIPGATSLASGIVIKFALTNAAEQREVADSMYAVAHGVRSLMNGTVPSTTELRATITQFAPSAAHWADLSTSLGSIYSGFYGKIDGDPKLAMQVLEAIARGCELAASQIIDPPQPPEA